MGDVKRVFVSYASRESELAKKLLSELTAHGFTPSSTESIRSLASTTDEKPGFDTEWQRKVEPVIKSADAVIVIISSKGESDRHQQFEWRAALESEWENPEKRLIPVLLQNAGSPNFLANKQGLRVKNPRREWGRAIKVLLCLLKGEEPSSREFLTVEEESLVKLQERLQYIEKVAQAMKEDAE